MTESNPLRRTRTWLWLIFAIGLTQCLYGLVLIPVLPQFQADQIVTFAPQIVDGSRSQAIVKALKQGSSTRQSLATGVGIALMAAALAGIQCLRNADKVPIETVVDNRLPGPGREDPPDYNP